MLAYVLGSGPSGVAVASGLLANGHRVVMLDYANQMQEETLLNIKRITDTKIDDWDEELLRRIKVKIDNELPDKLPFADDFPYKNGLELLNIRLENCGLKPSLAKGGLSNAWGASVLPFLKQDMAKWPVSIEELLPHYTAINKLLGVAAEKDDLSSIYPLNQEPTKLRLSPQIKEFYDELLQNRDYCRCEKIMFGYARAAYDSAACSECGLCMRGCPFDLIYSSRKTLSKLQTDSDFSYIPDVLVEKFEEINEQVIITATNRLGEPIEYICDKLFLAGGVLSTAKLVLGSLKSSQEISICETPYFVAPLFNFKLKVKDIVKAKFPTLVQLFLEINDDLISKNTIHLQVYPYNDMLLDMFKSKLGKLYFLFAPFIKWLLSKTLIIQGFFHSDEGNKIAAQLDQDGVLVVRGKDHQVDKKIKLLKRKLSKFGFLPLVQKSLPGRSFHCGGSFPMVEDVSLYDNIVVDRSGLIKGQKNVHIVDASIFPTIPAQTITYTIMANAYRIGTLF